MYAPKFEVLEHTADVGLVASGPTAAVAFEQAARGMISLMADLAAIVPVEERTLEVMGNGWEELLVNWLSEILYYLDGEQLIFGHFKITEIDDHGLRAVATGEPFDRARHYRGGFVKAVTYHLLQVEQQPDGWRAQVYLDI